MAGTEEGAGTGCGHAEAARRLAALGAAEGVAWAAVGRLSDAERAVLLILLRQMAGPAAGADAPTPPGWAGLS